MKQCAAADYTAADYCDVYVSRKSFGRAIFFFQDNLFVFYALQNKSSRSMVASYGMLEGELKWESN